MSMMVERMQQEFAYSGHQRSRRSGRFIVSMGSNNFLNPAELFCTLLVGILNAVLCLLSQEILLHVIYKLIILYTTYNNFKWHTISNNGSPEKIVVSQETKIGCKYNL